MHDSTTTSGPPDQGTPAGAAPSGRGAAGVGFGHRPALDALRGLAVLVVVAYHAGLPGARGGYLGVSLFFTLSGFLITTLLLEEHATHGRIDLAAFWRRRARRLLPAAVATLALVAVAVGIAARTDPSFGPTSTLGDTLASLLYVQNWHLLAAGTSYAEQFATPSPLTHLWSLAVEEQFYVVFPLLAAAAFWRPNRWSGGRGRLGALAVVAVAVAVVAPLTWADGIDRVYYGTDTRAGEIAVGVLLAVVIHRRATGRRPLGTSGRRTLGVAASVAALAVAAAVLTVRETSSLWQHGGFVLFACGSALLVAAAVLDAGPVARVGRAWPLRRLGLVSYAVYLLHWPILWVLGLVVDWGAPLRFVVALGLSIGAAELSYRWFEGPLRRDGRLGRLGVARTVPVVGALAAVALLVVVTAPRGRPVIDFAAAQAELAGAEVPPTILAGAASTDPSAPAEATTAAPLPTGPGPVRVAFFGDSTAVMTGKGVKDAVEGSAEVQFVPGGAELGCGIMIADRVRVTDGSTTTLADTCVRWPQRWADEVAANQPDVAVVQVGPWETFEMQWDGVEGWHHLGDDVADERARGLIRQAIAELSARGAHVVFLTATPSSNRPNPKSPCACPERVARWNQLVDEVASESPQTATVVDLAGWLAAQGPDESTRLLADGVHFSAETSVEVARRWLVPQLVAAAPATP